MKKTTTVFQRKLICINNSVLVTIPQIWLNYYSLKKGDKINLEIDLDSWSMKFVPEENYEKT